MENDLDLNKEKNETSESETRVENLVEASTSRNVNAPVESESQVKDVADDNPDDRQAEKKLLTEKCLTKQDNEKPILTSFKKRRRAALDSGSNPVRRRNNLQARAVRGRRRRISLRRVAMFTLIRKNSGLSPEILHRILQTEYQDVQGNNSQSMPGSEIEKGIKDSNKTTDRNVNTGIELPSQLKKAGKKKPKGRGKTEGKNDRHEKDLRKQDKEKPSLTSFKKRRRTTRAGSDPSKSLSNLQIGTDKDRRRRRTKSLRRMAIATLMRKNKGLPPPIKYLKGLHKPCKPETKSQDLQGSKSRMAENKTGIPFFVTNPAHLIKFQSSSESSLLQKGLTKKSQFSSSGTASSISSLTVAESQLQTSSSLELSSSSGKHQIGFQNHHGNNLRRAEEGTSNRRIDTDPADLRVNPAIPSLLQEVVPSEVCPPGPSISNPPVAVCQSQFDRCIESPHKSCKPKLDQDLQSVKTGKAETGRDIGSFATEPLFEFKSQTDLDVTSLSQEAATNKSGQLISTHSICKAISPKSKHRRGKSSKETLESFEEGKKTNKELFEKNKTGAAGRENTETSKSKNRGSKDPSNKIRPSDGTKSPPPPLISEVTDAISQHPGVKTRTYLTQFQHLCQKLFDRSSTKGISSESLENDNGSSEDFTNTVGQSTNRSLGCPVNAPEHENIGSKDFTNTGSQSTNQSLECPVNTVTQYGTTEREHKILLGCDKDPTIWMTLVKLNHSKILGEVGKWRKILSQTVLDACKEKNLEQMCRHISKAKDANSNICHYLTLLCDHQSIFNNLKAKFGKSRKLNLSNSSSLIDLPMSAKRVQTFTSLFLYLFKSLVSKVPMEPIFKAIDIKLCSSAYQMYISRKEKRKQRDMSSDGIKYVNSFNVSLKRCRSTMTCEIPKPEKMSLGDFQNHFNELRTAVNENRRCLIGLIPVASCSAFSAQICQNESHVQTWTVLDFLCGPLPIVIPDLL